MKVRAPNVLQWLMKDSNPGYRECTNYALRYDMYGNLCYEAQNAIKFSDSRHHIWSVVFE